jgi:peptidyl-prolyl cis-trans isomerase A (cyclophilin A)
MKTTIGLLAILAGAFAQTPPTVQHKAPMVNPALYKRQAPPKFKVKFTTAKGDFVVEVHRDWAPNGADRFYNLVRGGYFDGGPFYRVRAGFMAQFGFSPSPAVNKAWGSATIKDDPVTQSNKRGYITFAQTGAPNSRSTHLFINYIDNSRLDSQGFAPFGQVVEGMEVVDKLNPEYGDGDQEKISEGGAAFVKRTYPRMDLILKAEVMPADKPPTPVQTPAPKKQ